MSDLTTSPTGASYSPGSDAPVPAPATPAKPAARWEDFIDIFYNPSAVFARRQNSGFGVPLLIVTLLLGVIMIATFSALAPVMEGDFTRAIAKASQQPTWKPEMATTMRTWGMTIGRFSGFIVVPVTIFVTGLVLWMAGKFVDAKQNLNAAILVAAYAFMPRVLGAIVTVVQALVLSPDSFNGMMSVSAGPARFLNPDTASPVMMALASRLDLFTLWCTVLLAIGLSVTGKIPRSKAAIGAVIVWLLGALPALASALRA